MKILTMQIENQYKILGGAYERYMTLIEKFILEGYDVHHISPKGFKNINHRNLKHHAVTNIKINPRIIPFSIQSFFILFKIAYYEKIDYFIVFSPLEGLLGIIYKLLSPKTKLIISFRGDTVSNFKNNTKNKIKKYFLIKTWQKIDKIALNNADLIIFISEKNRQDIMKRSNFKKLENTKLVYNGITERLKKLSKEKAINFNTQKKIIGYVGLIYCEGKGLKYLLNAFYELIKDYKEVLLVIIGDGPDKSKIEKKIKEKHLEKDVMLIAYQKNPMKFMKSFDMLILPSTSEAFGMVLLESMYVGTPVIGSKVGGITEVLKYEELLFAPKDSLEIKNNLLKLLTNPFHYNNALKLCEKRKNEFLFDWASKMYKTITCES